LYIPIIIDIEPITTMVVTVN